MRIPLRARLVLLAGLAATPLAAQAGTPARQLPEGRPVVLGSDTVLTLRAAVPPFTLQQRALAISGGLAEASSRGDLYLRKLRVVPESGQTVIYADTVPLLAAHDEDAAVEGMPRDSVAARWAAALETAFARGHREASTRELLIGAGEALLATLLFGFFLWLAARLDGRFRTWLARWAEVRLTLLQPSKTRLISPTQVANVALGAARTLRLVLTLLLGYLWLVAIFGAFAWTRPLAARILRLVTEPVIELVRGLVDYLPSLFFIVVMVLVLRLVLRGIKVVFEGVEQGTLTLGTFPAEWADPTYKIVRSLVIAFGFILIFPYLPGAGSDAFKAISLFVGALFSLGSTGAVANVMAGTVIVYTRAFRVGDFVRIGETEGMVIERSLLVTRVRTTTNIDVSIPNSAVLGSHVQNFSAVAKSGGLIVQSRVTIGYDAPWRKVHDLLLDGARRTEGVLAEPAPFVVQEALNDYYPTYCLNAYTDRATGMEVFRLRSRLNENIQDAFFEGGVEILSPAFTAIRDGNRTAMPPNYLPPDYRAPGFRVEREDGPA